MAPDVTLERLVRSILAGDPAQAGLPPPMLADAAVRAAVAEIRRRHGVGPATHPEEALRAEGIAVVRCVGGPRCGAETDRRVLLPYHADRRVEALYAQHARWHVWARRLGLRCDAELWPATETDVWRLTLEATWPAQTRGRTAPPTWAPLWLVDALRDGEPAAG